jgi:hypothetical protein
MKLEYEGELYYVLDRDIVKLKQYGENIKDMIKDGIAKKWFDK